MWVSSGERGSVFESLGVVVILSSATPCCLMPFRGRTGALVLPHCAEPRSSCQSSHSHPVSRKALLAVHRRMTTRIGPPQGGQKATTGSGWTRRVGWQPMGCACKIIRRRVSVGMAQRACIEPKWRTFIKPSDRTCWRNLRINSIASRRVVRGRVLPGLREVQVTVRSVRATIRRVAIATVQTYGARSCRAEGACGVAWRWAFQGRVQTRGSMGSSRAAWIIASCHMAREMGARAFTGTKQCALEGRQVVRSAERPPPGTMSWMGGERSRDSDAQAVQSTRMVVMAGARA
jgi:hypothetical protein